MTNETNLRTVVLKVLVRPDDVGEVNDQLAELAGMNGWTVVHLTDQATTAEEVALARQIGAFGDADDQDDEADDGGDDV